jgi:hypothetical protein
LHAAEGPANEAKPAAGDTNDGLGAVHIVDKPKTVRSSSERGHVKRGSERDCDPIFGGFSRRHQSTVDAYLLICCKYSEMLNVNIKKLGVR